MNLKKIVIVFFGLSLMTSIAFAAELQVNVNTNFDSIESLNTKFHSYSKIKEKMDVKKARMEKLKKNLSALADVNFIEKQIKAESDASSVNYENALDATGNLEMNYENESIIFNKGFNKINFKENTPGLPDEFRALDHSKNYLTALALLPDNYQNELVVDHVGGINTTSYDMKTGISETFQNLVTIYYNRQINGLPVIGNSKIVVNLGKEGELISVIKKWTKINKTGKLINKKQLKTSNEAVRQLKNVLKRVYSINDKYTNVDVNEMKLVMFDDGNVIEPALYAVGNINALDGTIENKDWIVPVLKIPQAKYSINELEQVLPDDADELNNNSVNTSER